MNRKPIHQPETGTWRVPLTQGYETIVDDADVGLAGVLWTTHTAPHTVYAYRMAPNVNGKQKMVYLHRAILALKLGRDLRVDEHVDHEDGNGLNNTRANLRVCSHRENMANRRKHSNNTSGLKGVHLHKSGKWQAQIMVSGTPKHLGLFTSKEAAYAAYCEAAAQYHGEFANNG